MGGSLAPSPGPAPSVHQPENDTNAYEYTPQEKSQPDTDVT